MNFDDNALFRHPDISEMRDTAAADPIEAFSGATRLTATLAEPPAAMEKLFYSLMKYTALAM